MSDIDIRIIGKAGRITLTRPHALNAVTYEMVLAIEEALENWRGDPSVSLVIIDATGDKAFSAGGDLAQMYATGSVGDYSYGRKFWADEYRLNAKIAAYPKPYVAFCQGFTMGGGVGVSLHGSHRIVCESSKIAMPECGVGLVPDVGGSYLLGRAPGHLGEYLAITGFRMNAGDAIYAGFADSFVPEAGWADLISHLEETGDVRAIDDARAAIPEDLSGVLQGKQLEIDRVFACDVVEAFQAAQETSFAESFAKSTGRASPLAMVCGFELVRLARGATIEAALSGEYRFTHKVMEHGDFIEGIRSVIIDKDQSPQWLHRSVGEVTGQDIARMLAPLGSAELKL